MRSPVLNDLQIVNDFLRVPSPAEWLKKAASEIPLLLLDHAHCERKAAATAINLISKYPERLELVPIFSALAREELLHFEKVLELMRQRDIKFGPLKPSHYAQNLHREITRGGSIQRLGDELIVGAIIEARSCERFMSLISLLDDEPLRKFYATLVKAEARHFMDYLELAKMYVGEIDNRLRFFLDIENKLITGPDPLFRFHSGIPQ